MFPRYKLNKSTRGIYLIYFSIAQFNDNIKISLWNLNINNLMLINFHNSLITKRFFRYFDSHSDKTVTLGELLLNINNFSDEIADVMRKSHEFSYKIVRVITTGVSNHVDFLVNALYDVRALPADTQWRHDLPPFCCWVHLLIFCTPWCRPWNIIN